MKYDNYILQILLDKYENSEGFLKGNFKRRVLYKPGKDRELNMRIIDPFEKNDFFKAINSLKDSHLIDFKWEKFEVNNLISEIWLITNSESLERAYAICQRENKGAIHTQIIAIIQEQLSYTKTQWMIDLLSGIAEEALDKGKRWNSPLSKDQATEICKVLKLLDNHQEANIDKRILSVKLFSDSKYFEKHIQQKLLYIVHRYLFNWNDKGFTNREKLQQIGISAAPEIIYFTGPVKIILLNGEAMHYEPLTKGAYLGSDMLADTQEINGSYSKIVTIENLANYYWYIQNQRENQTLVIYTGGFLTRSQTFFLQQLRTEDVSQIFHWGDIDLGGFRILLQLQAVLPDIKPLKMNLETFERYTDVRKNVSNEYIHKIKRIQEKKEFEPFYDVLIRIIETKQILEQEAELYFNE